MRKRLAVGMLLALFSQITGINTVLYYGSIIISRALPGQSTSMALIANVISEPSIFLLTIVAMVFLDRWGRRAILMIASGGMGIALTFLVIGLNVPGISPLLMLACILLYVAFFALGMGPGPWLIISRDLPHKSTRSCRLDRDVDSLVGTLLGHTNISQLGEGSEPLGNICDLRRAFLCLFYLRLEDGS